MKWRPLLGSLSLLLAASSQPAAGVIVLGDQDANRNASTPGDNSGWQYEAEFVGFPATPIAPQYFVTARHFGGSVGNSVVYHGQTFATVEFYDDFTSGAAPQQITDLRLWKIAGTFPTYAPLYQGADETGKELRVFGRGAERGAALIENGESKGWLWSGANFIQRWGTNTVSAITDDGQYVQASFDREGGDDEAHLSAGDSGGGVFILEEGLWKLAAVNYGVELACNASGEAIAAAVFDLGGLYIKETNAGPAILVPDTVTDVPTSFYSTRISPRLGWLQSIIGGNLAALPVESYGTWLHSYYTPTEIADASRSAPEADPDGDGVSNLLEFAFNLDPTYPEPAVVTPDTRTRGLPLGRLEASGAGQKLTLEYVRRTVASGAALTYEAQFTDAASPSGWQSNSLETVTPINARWERVKVSDVVAASEAPSGRLARVRVAATGN